MNSVRGKLFLVVSLLAIVALAAGPVAAQARKKNWRKVEKRIQAHNAARIDKGGRTSLELIGQGTGKDRRTMAEANVDGNPRTRCVTWGVPIQYRIDLVDKLPVTQINFICTNYTGESPKDIEVRLSDGTVIKHTLEVIRPSKQNRYPRQTIEINRNIAWVEVKILSVHPGAIIQKGRKKGQRLGYGGIGEIEVITSADLAPYLVVPDFNPQAPVYIEGASPRNDYSKVKVTLPPAIPPGQFPAIYLSRDEIVRLRDKIRRDPRAKKMMETLITGCDQWVAEKTVFPDPKVPAQMNDRSDAQAKAHGLLSKKAGWLGWAYQLTDDEKYAKKARQILVGYAKLYPNDYKEHKGVHPSDTSKVMAQRLSEAMWLLPLIQGYDLVRGAPCMSEADRKLIEKDLIRCAIRFINRKRSAAAEVADRDKKKPDWRTAPPTNPRKTVGNWTNFYNAAYIQGGIVLRDRNWIDIGMANTRHNLHTGIGDDGMWGEGAIGYQLFGRHALVACLEALARQGIDLYGFEQSRFKNLFDSPLKYAYPDGTAPGINDSGRASIGGSWTSMAYDFAYLRYRDPNYGRLVNDAPRQIFQSQGCYFPTVIYEKLPEKPLAGLKSLIFGKLGYAILRGTDGGRPTYLLMDYGPHGGGHGHPDKLNLILFADGDELAGEPQGYRYEDRRHVNWTRPSVAHWTMSVDQHKQAPTTGKLLAFSDAGAIKVMRGTSDKAYAGVGLDRTVVQMPGYVADIYRGWSQSERTYDYPLCFRGALDALAGVDAATLKPLGLATQPGYKHIMVTKPLKLDGNWTGTWKREAVTVAEGQEFDDSVPNDDRRTHPANEVKAIVVGEPGTTIYVGTVPGGRHQAVIRRKGAETVFATVIDPYKASDAVKSAESFKTSGPVPAYGLKVLRSDGGTDLIIVRYDRQAEGKPAAASTGDGLTTNALVTVVRLDAGGKVIEMGLVGGTEAKAAGKVLKVGKPGIRWSK